MYITYFLCLYQDYIPLAYDFYVNNEFTETIYH